MYNSHKGHSISLNEHSELKKQMTGLGGGCGWLVPRRPKKYQGWSGFCVSFFIVFLNSPHRETPKNVIKNNYEKIGFGFFVDFL
jgi:hypothetical protein